jgi:protein-S-isoprenylcysteine O-methyltransferase Ste14
LASALGTVLAFATYARKIRVEERFLLEHFGEEYEAYRHESRRVIPWIW